MRSILLSGGSGKRLWPLSNDARSKQFLKVLRSPSGDLESMVQRVWRQMNESGLASQTLIATSLSQVEILTSQLGEEVQLVVEPERRDTFPAIALAASYLYSVESVSLSETVAVLPVDPFVEKEFFETLCTLPEMMEKSGADMALMGVIPTYPSEKYGYIIPARDKESSDMSTEEYIHVAKFQEKPCESDAALMIEQNALWNCGVFAFKLGYLINLLIEMELPIQYDEMLKQYGRLQKISFDYKIVEQAKKVIALPYNGFWKDLGTWNTLTEEMDTTVVGKGWITSDTQNTHLVNELNIPVAILGLSDVVVAVSPDGILVSDKESSPRIKEILKNEDQRPMYEERRWGCYRVLDHTRNEAGGEVLTKRICITAGKNLSYQYHLLRNEVWTVASGEGELILNGESRKIGEGDTVVIDKSMLHSVRAITELEIIEVQIGTQLIEEDIVRVSTEWKDIVQTYVRHV
ncbi:sugar phosphate nucleotidyltransferase [Paenibacillus polysaccharolyticus]|uniref:sugar phosphate nucleotidyltransferase n=1 Tax=Paenibacillus polysaccharolyticus TaxID=582692 RepID=UPI00203BAA9D|nr:sugar phosphate nucleotidyltransferase [Paenibacillus polysaccharolyticus]MCM3135342.1 sugar phosphate nucleotidyltransferase [Paenibacillus polysaccharolyticus]